jgi:hypothetical protein
MKLAFAAMIAAVVVVRSSAAFAADDDSHYKDLWELKQLHSAFHQSVSHAGVTPATKLQHLNDQLALWTDDAIFTAGGITYLGKGVPGTASCEAGSLTLCDFFSNHSGSFVSGRDWVSLTPLFTEKFEVVARNIASVYFQCIYLDTLNGDKVMSNVTFGLAGQPGSALARKEHGKWLFWDVVAGSGTLPTLDIEQ